MSDITTISHADFGRAWSLRRERSMALLDVRERWEFADGHIAGACPMPRGLLELQSACALPDRTARLFVYSSQEHRARLAAATLGELGYASVQALAGGLDAWRGASRPLATGWGAPGKRLGELIARATQDLQAGADEVATDLQHGRALVIDVRPPWEHEQGHVPGAVNVSGAQLPSLAAGIAASIAAGRFDRVYTHCAGRTRGIAAAQLLRSLGIASARAVENGCMGWMLSGRTLEFGTGGALALSSSRPVAEEACAPGTDPDTITAAELGERVSAKMPQYVVDVRTVQEFLATRVAGSLSLPAGQILIESETWLPLAALPVIVVGSSRTQANWAADHLRALGYATYILVEGIEACAAAGVPLAEGHAEPAFAASDIQHVAATQLADVTAWQLLDVRSAGEFGIAHLASAHCIPRGLLERRSAELTTGERPLLLISARGVRARLAAPAVARMVSNGRRVAVLRGGLAAARDAGHPLSPGSGDSSIASRDTPGRIPAAVWRQPLEQTRPVMLRYLAWEEALAQQD